MRRLGMVLGVVALLALAGVAWHGRLAAAGEPHPAPTVLGVDTFMTRVDEYRGPVQVQGIVASVSPSQKMLALIDAQEFDACGTTTCSRYTLPVSWGGPMPAVRAVVRVRGQVQETGGKLVFVATAVDAARTAAK